MGRAPLRHPPPPTPRSTQPGGGGAGLHPGGAPAAYAWRSPPCTPGGHQPCTCTGIPAVRPRGPGRAPGGAPGCTCMRVPAVRPWGGTSHAPWGRGTSCTCTGIPAVHPRGRGGSRSCTLEQGVSQPHTLGGSQPHGGVPAPHTVGVGGWGGVQSHTPGGVPVVRTGRGCPSHTALAPHSSGHQAQAQVWWGDAAAPTRLHSHQQGQSPWPPLSPAPNQPLSQPPKQTPRATLPPAVHGPPPCPSPATCQGPHPQQSPAPPGGCSSPTPQQSPPQPSPQGSPAPHQDTMYALGSHTPHRYTMCPTEERHAPQIYHMPHEQSCTHRKIVQPTRKQRAPQICHAPHRQITYPTAEPRTP
ncbi:nascent polypeptide-associated complex subunit alpha, muscle-specific form-like [Falco cherrug]|uniref:nascent polypeptide-associated complex subunit alpha, muscle-specific form-like n=1 Tax=Falco cherrug TaxID=345164 RepID=UPI0024791E70|nr:nascent polypeptide-associated complex subunit alpha, muscle-specific form-like [Falco cherrug]